MNIEQSKQLIREPQPNTVLQGDCVEVMRRFRRVMRDIAEFRAHEKQDPEDYAQRTVIKAQAELKQQKAGPGSTQGDETQAKEIGPDH
jgi:DNA-directed RNA polymerase specialized sigma24 family protein